MRKVVGEAGRYEAKVTGCRSLAEIGLRIFVVRRAPFTPF